MRATASLASHLQRRNTASCRDCVYALDANARMLHEPSPGPAHADARAVCSHMAVQMPQLHALPGAGP